MDDPNEKDVLSQEKPIMIKKNIIDRNPHWGDVMTFMPLTFLALLIVWLFYFYRNFWVIIWIVYALFPFLDYIAPHDNANLSERVEKTWANDKRFLIPLYLFWVTDVALYFWSLYVVSTGQIIGWKEWILFTYTLGNLCGANVVNGHELAHRREGLSKVMGTISFGKMIYSHFYIEHLFGHHMNVATENDPATAKKNEILYPYIIKSVVGGFKDAWKIENSWFHRRKRSAFHYSNRMIWFTLFHIVQLTAVYYFLGKQTLYYHLWYSACGTYLLETVNYIRHYGLQRKMQEDGSFEKIGFTHSWNAPQRFTNYLLFNLQRHSDHHYDSSRPYQVLRSLEQSPIMPHGYSVCVVLAMVTPVWFAIMNPYVDAQRQGEELKPAVKKRVQFLIVATLIVISGGLTFAMIFI